MPDSRITGVASDQMTLADYIELVETNLQKFVKSRWMPEVLTRLKAKLQYVQIDLTQEQMTT